MEAPRLAENPLLPNAELRALHTWTQRAEALARKQARRSTSTSGLSRSADALFSGTLLQLRPGDILVPEATDGTAAALVAPQKPTSSQILSVLHASAPETGVLYATGLAAALKRSGADGLVLAFVHAGLAGGPWADALTWAQTEQLPLILVIADPSGSDTFRPDPAKVPGTLTWTSLQKLSKNTGVPVLSVDGEDAVAVYRVMQESVLRARSGSGPAVLWAMLPSAEDLRAGRPASSSPLRRLERYLRTRAIPW